MTHHVLQHPKTCKEGERVNCICLALGTNLGQKRENMERACRMIEERIGKITAKSDYYETAPVGFASDNLFLNGAVTVETSRTADDILQITQEIEREMGRTRKSENGVHFDRLIDIDLLIYGTKIIHSERLELPHPHLHERRFVLEPLCEIAPKLIHPTLKTSMEDLLKKMNEALIIEINDRNRFPDLLESVNRLLPQLSATADLLTEEALEAIIQTPNTHLYMLLDEMQQICGMATLAVDALPTGRKAWIEDVVVDGSCRGRGYGRQMIEHLIEVSKALGVKSLNLTSRPTREAANRLYRSCGFKQRETNVYKLTF